MPGFRASVLLAAALLAGCASRLSPAPSVRSPGAFVPAAFDAAAPRGANPIQHIVVIVQENRSFNSLFVGFPNATTSSTGATHTGSRVPVAQITLETTGQPGYGTDINHSHSSSWVVEYDGGKNDGFDKINFGSVGQGGPAGLYPYAFVEKSETKPYWDLAAKYTLLDRLFSTATTGSFVAHQQLIAGTTQVDPTDSVTDYPNGWPWGCDAGRFATTNLLNADGTQSNGTGPPPCFHYKSMAESLDAKRVSWKYYVPAATGSGSDFAGSAWNAFDAIYAVRYGPDWTAHISSPNTNIFSDLKSKRLPAVSWVIPILADSDHPDAASNTGPSWVASVVNAIGTSSYWNHTAIVIVWDDWGGFYDPVVPPHLDYTSLSFRVGGIVVSPYAPRKVNHERFEFGSILKMIEQTFRTPSLGSTDVRANSLLDALDFTQPPTRFVPVSAPYPRAFFLRPRPAIPVERVIEADGYPG